jgi:transcriptional regulator with XRE-family HTH domain
MSDETSVGELFGSRLRELRRKRGVTQVLLSERSGLQQSHLSDMERGEKLPNLVTLLRLAAALGCKTSDLVSVFDKVDVLSILPK